MLNLRISTLLLAAIVAVALAQEAAVSGSAAAGTSNAPAAVSASAAAGTSNAPAAVSGSAAAGTSNAPAASDTSAATNTNNPDASSAASSGFFGSIFRGAIGAARRVMNADFGLKSSALDFSMDATNQVAGGIIKAKQLLENTKAGVASSAAQFGTKAAAAKADMVAGLVSPLPIFGSLADSASRLFTAGANSVNAGLQTGIAGMIGAKNAKLDAIRYGVEYGTGAIKSGGKAALDAKKSFINRGLDMAANAGDMVDSALSRGHAAFNSGLDTVNSYVNSARTSADTVAAQARDRIQGSTAVNA